MPIGAIIGAGASIGGALLSSKSQKSAANTAMNAQVGMVNQNNALTRDIYNKNAVNLAPYNQAGQQATGQINALLAGNPQAFDAFRNSTNYQFRLGQGVDALNHGYAARGMLQSGAAMKGINEYGQNFASNELGNYMGQLGQQQQVGMGAASALAGVGQNMVNNVSRNNELASDAIGGAALARSQANQQMYAGVGNALGGLASSFKMFR